MTTVVKFLVTLLLAASTLVVDVESNFYPRPGVGGGGFDYDSYRFSCPQAEDLVLQVVASAVAANPRSGAGLIRTFFHDCFVEGCDGSVFIDSTPNNVAEKDAIPNLTLHGFGIVDSAKQAVEAVCPGTVSCADIIAIAARDSVRLLHGPFYRVKTGRRDGRVSQNATAFSDIPSPLSDLNMLTDSFARKGLSQRQMVTLSGLHTVGKASCAAFINRLYNFSPAFPTDPTLNPIRAAQLKADCPPGSQTSTTVVDMDPVTPTIADNQYFVNLVDNNGLFTSDQVLVNSPQTRFQVLSNARIPSKWAFEVIDALTAMGDVGVKTGFEGEIRLNCRVINP